MHWSVLYCAKYVLISYEYIHLMYYNASHWELHCSSFPWLPLVLCRSGDIPCHYYRVFFPLCTICLMFDLVQTISHPICYNNDRWDVSFHGLKWRTRLFVWLIPLLMNQYVWSEWNLLECLFLCLIDPITYESVCLKWMDGKKIILKILFFTILDFTY